MKLENLTYELIKTATLDDFIEFFKINDLKEVIEKEPVKLEFIFQAIRKKLKSYDLFCDFIVKHVPPIFEFYLYSSDKPVFFAKNKVPKFYFEKIDDTEYSIDYIAENYNNFAFNVEDSIEKVNKGVNGFKIIKLIEQFYINVYASKLYFLEAGNGGGVVEVFDMTKPNFSLSEKEDTALKNIYELEESYTCLDNIVADNDASQEKIIIDNYSKIIGTSESLLSKIIIGILKREMDNKDKIIARLISNYEKVSNKKYTFDVTNFDLDKLYNEIIDYYILKLINGSMSSEEKKYMTIELMNARYEQSDIVKYIPLIESKIIDAKDEYLLLIYQVLLSEEYAKRNGFVIDKYFYTDITPDEGGYEEEENTIRFYINIPEAMEDPYTIYSGMETSLHETRHAYQYFNLMHQMNYNAFLNDIERVILLKPYSKDEYKERYESIYYERDARVYAFYETYKHLKDFNHHGIKDYIKNKFHSKEEYLDLKLWNENSGEEFLDNAKAERTPETFKYLIEELYKRYSLSEIASMREEFPTFREVINEDGTLCTIDEIINKFNSCIKYDENGYITNESLNIRAFLYNYINMYQRCIDIETNLNQTR